MGGGRNGLVSGLPGLEYDTDYRQGGETVYRDGVTGWKELCSGGPPGTGFAISFRSGPDRSQVAEHLDGGRQLDREEAGSYLSDTVTCIHMC